MQKNKVIIIVIDALRPDSITKGSMPTLWTLAERGRKILQPLYLFPFENKSGIGDNSNRMLPIETWTGQQSAVLQRSIHQRFQLPRVNATRQLSRGSTLVYTHLD